MKKYRKNSNRMCNSLVLTQMNVLSALSLPFQIFYYSYQRGAGRPEKTISKELLENLLMLKVPISGVASFFEVSRLFVYKAIRDYGIEYKKFTDLSDSRLAEIVASVKENHPRAGEVMLQGHLRAQGLHVQRNRLRTAIHQSDPIGTEARRRPPIRRRVYSVPCPNYLWHIDGNHKLIRWRMVLHHAVDGFSRLIVFCRCSTNNRAATVLSLYQEAVRQYGRPFRVRTDHGGGGGKCRRLERHGKCLGRRGQIGYIYICKFCN